MISQIKKLRDIQSAKNIPAPSYYTSQLAHCPLHTARRTTEKIGGSATLVLGIAECAYYVKNAGGHGDKDNSLFSVVLDWHDVTFGCTAKLESALEELMQEYDPKAVFIITTCVPEITGDDVDSLAEAFRSKYGIAVMVVHTEHFKTTQESAGVQNALSACIEMMKSGDDVERKALSTIEYSACITGEGCKNECVNILGHGKKDFFGSELSKMLKAAGISVGVHIPDCSVEELERASKAKLNIVVDSNALLLAKKMEERFHIPYVSFDEHIYPQRVFEAYEHLFDYLGKTMPEAVTIAFEKACNAIVDVRKIVSDTSYFYERTEFPTFELNAFLCELGMTPQLIVTQEFPGKDSVDLQTILQYSDPYVTQSLNQTVMQTLRDELKPDRLFGGRRGGGHGKHETKRNGFDVIIEFVYSLTGNETGKRQSEDTRRRRRREGRRFK